MKLDPECCLGCGNSARPFFRLTVTGYPTIIAPNGNISGTRYWSCSDKCTMGLLSPYMSRDAWLGESYLSAMETAWRALLNEISAREARARRIEREKANEIARKEAEKRLALEAEQAKWRPKPFSL